jgi:hypothetical protein
MNLRRRTLAAPLSFYLVAIATAHAQTTSFSIQHLAFSIQDSPSPLPSRPVVLPTLTPAVISDDRQLILFRQWTHDYQDW